MQRILIIDDNDGVREALEILYSIHGIGTVTAASPAEGLAALADDDIDLVIQDMNFAEDTTSGGEGVQLFHQIRARRPDLPIILLTAWSNLETAVELVKSGAADYLSKPWDDTKLITTSRNLLELASVRREQRESARERARAR
jgi:DNA-binding NtrC family response regulator